MMIVTMKTGNMILRKGIIVFCLFFLFSFAVRAQYFKNRVTLADSVVNVSTLKLGTPLFYISYELNYYKNFSAELSVGTPVMFQSGIYGTYIYLPVDLLVIMRWYYNRPRRLRKGKDVAYNAGNFFSLGKAFGLFDGGIVSGGLTNGTVENIVVGSFSYGMRRNLGKKKYFSYVLGISGHMSYRPFDGETWRDSRPGLRPFFGIEFNIW